MITWNWTPVEDIDFILCSLGLKAKESSFWVPGNVHGHWIIGLLGRCHLQAAACFDPNLCANTFIHSFQFFPGFVCRWFYSHECSQQSWFWAYSGGCRVPADAKHMPAIRLPSLATQRLNSPSCRIWPSVALALCHDFPMWPILDNLQNHMHFSCRKKLPMNSWTPPKPGSTQFLARPDWMMFWQTTSSSQLIFKSYRHGFVLGISLVWGAPCSLWLRWSDWFKHQGKLSWLT